MEAADHVDIMHVGQSIEKYTDEWVWILKPEVTCSCMAVLAKLLYMDRQTMSRLPLLTFERTHTYTRAYTRARIYTYGKR